MKRIFFLFTLVGTLLFTSSYAAPVHTSPVVKQAFQNSFFKAQDVTWEQVGILTKVSFSLDGEYKSVFYNAEGDEVAVTQNLPSAKLPKNLGASLKAQLAGSWITSLFAVSVDGEATYYAVLENADTITTLKSVSDKKWAVFQKSDK